MARVEPGDTVRIRMPWSEACMYLKVAGQMRQVQVFKHGAQILNEDGTRLSFPITLGEAGIFTDANGLYIREEA